ncbi:MAG: T9SS type A sorting domain-containing protein [Bacteroidales bacterium]
MEVKKLKFCIFILLLLGTGGLQAQKIHHSIATAGGDASNSGGSVAYTIGQTLFTMHHEMNVGTLNQGIQQPYEVFLTTGIDYARKLDIKFSAYPNPVTDKIILKVEGNLKPGYRVSVYDIHGKILEKSKITSTSTDLFMDKLEPAIYLLKITNNNKEITTFKIIKK